MILFKMKKPNSVFKNAAVILVFFLLFDVSVSHLQATRMTERDELMPTNQSNQRKDSSRRNLLDDSKVERNDVNAYVRDVRADSRQSRIDSRDIRTDFKEIRSELDTRRNLHARDNRFTSGEDFRNQRNTDSSSYRDSGVPGNKYHEHRINSRDTDFQRERIDRVEETNLSKNHRIQTRQNRESRDFRMNSVNLESIDRTREHNFLARDSASSRNKRVDSNLMDREREKTGNRDSTRRSRVIPQIFKEFELEIQVRNPLERRDSATSTRQHIPNSRQNERDEQIQAGLQRISDFREDHDERPSFKNLRNERESIARNSRIRGNFEARYIEGKSRVSRQDQSELNAITWDQEISETRRAMDQISRKTRSARIVDFSDNRDSRTKGFRESRIYRRESVGDNSQNLYQQNQDNAHREIREDEIRDINSRTKRYLQRQVVAPSDDRRGNLQTPTERIVKTYNDISTLIYDKYVRDDNNNEIRYQLNPEKQRTTRDRILERHMANLELLQKERNVRNAKNLERRDVYQEATPIVEKSEAFPNALIHLFQIILACLVAGKIWESTSKTQKFGFCQWFNFAKLKAE